MSRQNQLKKIIIVGAGGMGGDTQWLIERINRASATYDLLGYVDDGILKGNLVNDYPVLGGMEVLEKIKEPVCAAFAIGNPQIRRKLLEQCRKNDAITYPNLIDPSVIMSDRVKLGQGNIICASVILTMNLTIGDFNLICNRSIVGHDDCIGDFNTLYPGVLLSGTVTLKDRIQVGTGSQVIQGLKIENDIIIGAGGTVIQDLLEPGTYVGAPVKRVVYEK